MRLPLIAALATLLLAAPASAADQTIAGQDATTGAWSPQNVTIDVGDTVTWVFDGTTQAHNVASSSSNWSLTSPILTGHPPVQFTFTAAGTYTFVCNVHPDTMKGTVSVDTPPPPPPPLSEQPFPNDQPPPTVLELTDDTRPSLTRVSAARIAHGARVRFRASEPGRVTVRVRRGDRVAKSRTVRVRRAGLRTVDVHGLSAGSYRVEVRARDLAGNRSRMKRARVTVR